MKSVHWMFTSAFVAAALAATTGCQSTGTAGANDGMVRLSHSQPFGGGECGAAKLDSVGPAEVTINQPFTYTFTVTNNSDTKLGGVVLTDRMGSGLELVASRPQAAMKEGNVAVYALGTLEPKESKTVTATMVAKSAGEIGRCASVTYDELLCAKIAVVAPKLGLAKSMPATAQKGEVFPVRLVVSNTGSGTLKNVVVNDALPAGLTTADGKMAVAFNLPELAAGQSKEFTFNAKGDTTGRFVNPATATAAGGLAADAEAPIVIQQAEIAIVKEATRDWQYAGRQIGYTVTVANTGDTAATDVVVTDPIPAGTTFVKASDNGKASGGKITWALGTMAVGAKRTLDVTLVANEVGTVVNTATVATANAGTKSASAKTPIRGVPGLTLSEVDATDPIEVGQEETYTVTLTNQGSMAVRNVKLVATLDASQSYVSQDGPTKGAVAGNVVTFAPVASLGPKQSVTFTVTTKVMKAGTAATKFEATTPDIGTPLIKVESTTQY